MRTVVVGASAGLGRELALELARRGHDLVLLASDPRDLAALASHVSLLHGVRATAHVCTVSGAREWVRAAQLAIETDGGFDWLLFPIGASRDDDRGTLEPGAAEAILGGNFSGITHLTGALLPGMLARGSGTIAGFGSIAAARGRGQNVVYSAAKSALRTYFESLRHLAWRHGIQVQFFIVGYMDTQQSFGKRLPLPVASPAAVASAVIDSLERGGSGVRHLPRFWRLVEWAVKCVPFAIFREVKA